MAAQNRDEKLIVKTVALGVLSAAMYACLAIWHREIAEFCVRGGWVAVVPIGIALAFSLVHGAFTGNFWSVLGIKAAEKRK